MKLIIKQDGSLEAHVEPKTIKDGFRAIGEVRAFLIAEPCGCCKSKNTFPSFKTPKGYKYYQWECADCGAVFQFGQNQEGDGLFPKRNDQNHQPLPNRGWSKYQGNGQAPRNGQASGSQEPAREPESYPQEELPFAFWLGLLSAGLGMLATMA